jgi:hypothetical protein
LCFGELLLFVDGQNRAQQRRQTGGLPAAVALAAFGRKLGFAGLGAALSPPAFERRRRLVGRVGRLPGVACVRRRGGRLAGCWIKLLHGL